MVINLSLTVNHSHNEKSIFSDIKCFMLDHSAKPCLQANGQHTVENLDTSIWRFFKFHWKIVDYNKLQFNNGKVSCFNPLNCVLLVFSFCWGYGRFLLGNYFYRYKFLEELGDGTCGTVYKALDLRIQEIVSSFFWKELHKF